MKPISALIQENTTKTATVEEHHDGCMLDTPIRKQRKLVDYTLTSGRERTASDEQIMPSSPKIQQLSDVPEAKIRLPCFASLDKATALPPSPPTCHEEETINFFLRIPTARRPRGNSLGEMREAWSKTKTRSQKSRLFGSLGENGKLRRSYADLKDDARLPEDRMYLESNSSWF